MYGKHKTAPKNVAPVWSSEYTIILGIVHCLVQVHKRHGLVKFWYFSVKDLDSVERLAVWFMFLVNKKLWDAQHYHDRLQLVLPNASECMQ